MSPSPSMSRLGLSLCALTSPYCTPHPLNMLHQGLQTKNAKERPCQCSAALCYYWYLISRGFIFVISTGKYEKRALNSRFKRFQLRFIFFNFIGIGFALLMFTVHSPLFFGEMAETEHLPLMVVFQLSRDVIGYEDS